ncbi:hypothetical protein LV89_02088 [Arcicella aurantiaca]|uniref:Uncharacterized protein n=1 Tax=Arcicella aurantiaca TaxID=591202 RepID=A0A316E8S3_9BACT|nr:hypothetical protein [Arcicella aurantiaca]PWK26882.1 hypothetical protein LV89_02088 [Arcicella aurantiaca]
MIFLGLSVLIDIAPSKQEFGIYHCECTDSCAVVYGVTSNSLTLDYPTRFCSVLENQTSTRRRIINKVETNQFLLEIPLIMFFEPRGVFGFPDSADQGGYYFSFEFCGLTRKFIFDTKKGYEPFYFRYINKIRQKMDEISEEFSR